tara:strand:- start:78 stop:896 length:819 start_codon:yes stop_codon:yes gene_type:complete
MQINYKYLNKKYLKYFNYNKEHCNFVLTDVIFSFKELNKYIKPKNIRSILEIGSGTGVLLNELKLLYPKKKFVGVDPNESGFHNYEGISKKINKSNIVKKSVNNFKSNKKFDLIFSTNVFEHVKSQTRYIEKTYNLLNKNGKNIIICPNYDFPYEPHFVLPIIINKKITKIIFKNIIYKHEKMSGEKGLWDGININGKKKVERILKSKKIVYKFDYLIKDRMIDRILKDDTFKKRQGIAASLAIFCRSIYIDKLMFNILKIPFPYMKLIIKK